MSFLKKLFGFDASKDPVLVLIDTLLTDPAYLRRIEAVRELDKLGDERAIYALRQALVDTDETVRSFAAQALGTAGWQPEDTADHVNYHVARFDFEQAVTIGDAAAVPLVAALKNMELFTREGAGKQLARLGRPAAEALIASLSDPEDTARVAAAHALKGFVKELNDPEIRALLLEPVKSALLDSNSFVHNNAIGILELLKDVSAIEPLLAAASNPASGNRSGAVKALHTMIPQLTDAGKRERVLIVLIKSLQDKDSEYFLRKEAAEALGDFGDPEAVKPLIAALGDAEDAVCWAAAEALGKLGDRRAVEPLIAALANGSETLQIEVARALGHLGDERAIEPLVIQRAHAQSDFCQARFDGALSRLGYEPVQSPVTAASVPAERPAGPAWAEGATSWNGDISKNNQCGKCGRNFEITVLLGGG